MKAHFLANYKTLYKVKNMLDNMSDNNEYFSRTIINQNNLDTNTISIVMTACNRSIQTYFTLKTINNSEYKNVQVILIDDSTYDPVLPDKLKYFDTHVELISIKKKFWVNPCVNYNIGFKYVEGGKVIIQNAEVCHLGDVIKYTAENVVDNKYHVFNVTTISNMENNYKLYEIEPFVYNSLHRILPLCNSTYFGSWYQHHIYRNAFYHFLTACTKNTFDIFKGFDIDYALGIEYDDDQLVFDIRANGINFVNVPEQFMGIHQWHTQSASGSLSNNHNNRHIFEQKKNYYNNNKKLLSFVSFKEEEIVQAINNYL